MKSDLVDLECRAVCTYYAPRVCDRVIVSVVVLLLLLFGRMIDFYQRLGALLFIYLYFFLEKIAICFY